ncbi:hypothetical protein MPL3356_690010 [Mesorhizobium plurifarium]|uniref:Uncharacterized protein n=1 Tax=Mesorhizobium plurifarium TaxID=69974 RepID=A0A090G8Y0_MESPL|nr:hypothetical protein MPL3356_690010 [Mesorhizobium plurifarium]
MERRRRQPVLYCRKLAEQRPGKIGAQIRHGIFYAWPDVALRLVDQPPAVAAQRNDPAPLVFFRGVDLDKPQLGKQRHAARHARLGDTQGLRQLADRQRAQPVERGEQRVLARLDAHVQAVEHALRVGLQLLAYALHPAAEAEKAEGSKNIFHGWLVINL